MRWSAAGCVDYQRGISASRNSNRAAALGFCRVDEREEKRAEERGEKRPHTDANISFLRRLQIPS